MPTEIEIYEKNYQAMIESDRRSKLQGALVGRYISHTYADGEAYYKITATTKTQATIEVITGIGDDWILPAWGVKTKIPLATALKFIYFREKYDELFHSKR